MTLAKVSAGQPLRIPADAYNAFIEVAAAFQASQRSRSAGNGAVTPTAGIIVVRNDSGSDQDRFAVLGLDAPLVLPTDNLQAFQERIALTGVLPNADHHGTRFCILQEPIASGAIGRAMVTGVTPAQIEVQADDDAFAAVITGETTLQSGGDGGACVLWKESGTGTRWAVLQVPAGGAGDAPNLVLKVSSTSHGWGVGDVLHWSGSAWTQADAGAVAASDTLAVVGSIPDADTALIVLWGILCLDGLEPHTDYWLDPTAPGALTATKPDSAPRLVLHHAENRLCIVRAGAAGSGGGGADRFADLTDVDVSTLPTDGQAPLWDATAQRWRPHAVVKADPVPTHQVLVGPSSGADAAPKFRDLAVDDLASVSPTSVLVNASGQAGRPSALAATTDATVLLRLGGRLQWLAITTAAIADGAITTAKLADAAVVDAKISSLAWAKLTGVPIAFPPSAHDHLLGGDLQGTTASAHLRDGAIVTTAISDGAVTNAKIASVDWSKLTNVPTITVPPHEHNLGGDLNGTTANAQIAAGAVGTAELAPGAVATATIADGAVTNRKLQADYLRIGGATYHLGDDVPGGLVNPMTAAGDLIVGGSAGAPQRLPGNPGGTAQVLMAKSGSTQFVAHTLSQMEGVAIASPQDKQVLAFDAASSRWVNSDPGSSGTFSATSVWGNAGAAPAAARAVSATVDDSVLMRVGGVLVWTDVVTKLKLGGPSSLIQFVGGATAPTHVYDGVAFKQQIGGRTRFFWNATDYWEFAPNGSSVEIAAVVGGVRGHRLLLTASATLSGASRTLYLREVDVCDNGVAKKMAILASDPY